MENRERSIASAIRDYNAGVFKSQRAAAKAYNIPLSTLHGRLRGATNSAISHQHQQRLSPEQEKFLVEWILDEDSYGRPPSHARAREMATRILRANGDEAPLGKLWVPHFLRRNPRVASIVGRAIEARRASGASHEVIHAFFELFERTRIRLGIQNKDIYNMDETGIALGVCSNAQVLASSSKKKAYIKSPENREWVSAIETISADGRKLRSAVIFKGKSLQTTWFPSESVPDWLFTTSENGWTSNSIGLEWLQRIFIPSTDPGPLNYRLLILDGHGSHASIEFLWACKQHKIELLFLPPHTSHVLQPLDLSPFSLLKSSYRTQIRELAALEDAAHIKKERFIKYYYKAREEGLSVKAIRAGWKASGLVPYNPELVLRSSQVTGRPITPPLAPLATELHEIIYRTPQRPQDVHAAQQLLQQSENLSRSMNFVLRKTSKAIGMANTREAALRAENQRLRHQLEALQPQTRRKRVTIDANQRFADVETIMSSIAAAGTNQVNNSINLRRNRTEGAAIVAAAVALESMCTQWQI